MKKNLPKTGFKHALAVLTALGWLLGAAAAFAAGAKVTMVQPVDALSFAPIYVAISKGFFKDEGIELDFVVVREPATTAALVSGEAPFMASGSLSPVRLAVKEGPRQVLATNAFARALTFQMIASNRWMKKANINPRASIKEKLQAMKGATLGAPSVGGLSEQVMRYYLQDIGGLKPADVSFVTVGFSPAAMIGAMDTGQIDGFGGSPPGGPEVVRRGSGTILISGWDVPELGNMVYETLVTTKDYAAKHPDIVTKVTRAVARGSNYVVNHLSESTKILQARFNKMDPQVVAESMQALVPAFGNSGRMSVEMWENAMKLWRSAGIKEELDLSEEGIWTNRFIVNIPKE